MLPAGCPSIRQCGDAHTALQEIAFLTTVRTCMVQGLIHFRMPPVAVSVVTREEEQGIVEDVEFLEQLDQFAHRLSRWVSIAE